MLPQCWAQKKTAKTDQALSSAEQETIDFQKEHLLPINHNLPDKQRISLLVQIPAGYRHLQPLTSPFQEYIPKADDEYTWSEIITTQAIIGRYLTAKYQINSLKDGFLRTGTDAEIITESFEDHPGYSTGFLEAIYSYQGRREYCIAKYYSGPYDCVGYQYTIALSSFITKADAAKKVQDFMKHTFVLKL